MSGVFAGAAKAEQRQLQALYADFGALDNSGGTASTPGDAAAGRQGPGAAPDQPQAAAPVQPRQWPQVQPRAQYSPLTALPSCKGEHKTASSYTCMLVTHA